MTVTSNPTPKSRGPEQVHEAYDWIRSEPIDSLNVVVEEYRHRVTGAQHFHISADNPENVFVVAFRTVPMDSTGVAHILEHTVLCGSEHYPVRDPFFMMIRRSLNTFMNAFTSSDWTAYPFASQNRKDFHNLLDVYLDAAFFARLDPLDFAQEGHRMEFENPEDPDSRLVYKGVVYNEMKGAMSSPTTVLWQTMSKHLFPTTTYHYNSGGDPEQIPTLGYEDLKAFYKTHYHPSNALFMTYGDIPAYEHHVHIHEKALARFDRLDVDTAVGDERRFTKPVSVKESYPLSGAESGGDKTHVVLGWLLGRSTELDELLKAHLLSGVLLENGASPLRHALETTEFGTAPSPLCGLEDSHREMVFVCGIEGSRPERAEALEQLVLDVLHDVAENGVPREMVDAVLHQLELHQREIGGDGFPYGLQLIVNCMSAAVHRGDPIAVLNLDPALQRLREQVQDPEFIKDLVRRTLIENKHRVRLTMEPDPGLAARREAAAAEHLAQVKASLTEAQHRELIDRARHLQERQQQQDDPELLPKVGRDDIPPDMSIPEGTGEEMGPWHVTYYGQGTNGLVYQQIIAKLPQLDTPLLETLPYYTRTLTELGCGGRDYLETQAWQSRVSGGLSAYTTVRGRVDDVQQITGHFVLSGKALTRRHRDFCELIQSTLEAARFDEHARLRELIAQERARLEQSVTGHGHALAMTAAASGMSPAAALAHRLRGLAGIRTLKALDDSLNDKAALGALAERLHAVHRQVVAAPREFLLIGEPQDHNALRDDLATVWTQGAATNTGKFDPFTHDPVRQRTRQMWTTDTQVSFCAKVYPTVPVEHPDAPALDVLSGFLRNGFLHRAIREQGGAYGGGASHDSDNAAFRFFSYRDPRLKETLEDFDRSIEWLLTTKHEPRQLEEAILGVIGSIDKPGSPSGEAKEAFHNMLYGRTPAQRKRYRLRVLDVTLDDLRRVAEAYLQPETASEAVITNTAALDQHGDLGMEVFAL